MDSDTLWWKKPLRVIQTNLQVRDTEKMNPAQIAQNIQDMGGNVLVTNVGGIYVWYPTKVPAQRQHEHQQVGKQQSPDIATHPFTVHARTSVHRRLSHLWL